MTDLHEIILDDPSGPAKTVTLRLLLEAQEFLMSGSTPLKSAKITLVGSDARQNKSLITHRKPK